MQPFLNTKSKHTGIQVVYSGKEIAILPQTVSSFKASFSPDDLSGHSVMQPLTQCHWSAGQRSCVPAVLPAVAVLLASEAVPCPVFWLVGRGLPTALPQLLKLDLAFEESEYPSSQGAGTPILPSQSIFLPLWTSQKFLALELNVCLCKISHYGHLKGSANT